jgi:two-component system sensor histidine kinase YesM
MNPQLRGVAMRYISHGMQFFRDLKIQDKIFICFVMIILLAILSMGIFSYYKSSSILDEKTGNYNFQTVKQISTSVDYTLQRLDDFSSILSFDQNIQQMLNMDFNLFNDREKLAVIDQIEKIMITHYNSTIMGSINIFGNNGMVFKVPSSSSANLDNDDQLDLYIKEAEAFGGKNKWINETSSKGVLKAVRQIKDLQTTTKPLGTVIISLKYETIAKLLQDVNFDKDGLVMLIDEKGKWVTPVESIFDGIDDISNMNRLLNKQSGTLIQSIKGKQYLISYITSNYSGWKLIGIISKDKLYKDNYKIRNGIFILTLVILILAFLLARIIAQTISLPIKRLLKPMKRAEMGDLKVSIPINSKDEIGILSQGFNHMISQMNSMVEVVYKGKIMLKESELKALQAQINPHFLYNTLESINWMAKMNGVEQICGMVSALGDLMRISISTEKEYITIEEEIKYISDYLFIQKVRFGERIHTDLQVAEDLYPILIPKLILQPIVENALLHGVQVKKGKALVKISGKRMDGDILFEIEDNGVGMTAEQSLLLLKGRNEWEEGKKAGIGIYNVHQRIRFIYGEKYGIRIFSTPAKGTTIQILIADILKQTH